jgi:short-subunit dehydrogenase
MDRERLEGVASEVRAAHGVEVRAAVLDLGGPDVAREARELARGLDVGLLVYNAAFAPIGRFVEQELADGLKALDVNCRGPLMLTHVFAPLMVARGRGGILLLSSMAALHGTAMVATYAATKAFNLVLAEGLWSELRESGVDVLACCPGATRTPGYLRSNPRGNLRPMDPGAVVTEALDALGRRSSLIAGRSNRLAAFFLARLLPRETAVKLVSRATRRMYDGE